MLDIIKNFFGSPFNVTFLLAMILGIMLIAQGFIGRSIERRKNIIKRGLGRTRQAKSFIDELLDKSTFITNSEEELDKQLDLLGIEMEARDFTKIKGFSAFMAMLLGLYLQNFIAMVPLTLIFINIPTSVIRGRVKKRQNMYSDQILESFQVFISEFTTTRSVQKTIVNISPKLNYPIRREFERLGRKLNSGESPESCFLDFAQRTNNKWTMIFAQMLITYYDTGADFIDQLLSVTTNITNERVLEEQNKTELSSMRIMNIAMNALVPVAYISNRLLNPQEARIYIETAAGKNIIIAVAFAVFFSLYLGEKISEH